MQRNKLWFVAVVTLFAVSARAQNTFPANGSVGIGTTNPQGELHINGANQNGNAVPLFKLTDTSTNQIFTIDNGVNANDFRIVTWGGTTGNLELQAGSNGNQMVLNSSGNVGVQAANPLSVLQVGSPVNGLATPSTTFSLINPSGDAGLTLSSYVPSLNQTQPVGGIFASAASGWSSVLHFRTNNNWGNPTVEAMTINGGNVGIGTTTPAYRLDVAGQIHSSGGVVFPDGTSQTTAFIPSNCGADYAESVEVTGDRTKYEPGDVLVIDPNAPGKFLKSNQSYSTLVAGIYSTQPGFVGRLHPKDAETDKTEVPMAMVGRVPTKVTTENGPIKVGDLLVASSTLGHAMKGTDRSLLTGAVIGKALGSLDSGTGVIEVLVTLQ